MNYRNRDLLDCAYQFPCLLRFEGICEGGAGEPAHSNQSIHGKGAGMKSHDVFHIPACRSCHRELDQGKSMDRETKFAAWNRAYGFYLPELFVHGWVRTRR